jgi:transposase
LDHLYNNHELIQEEIADMFDVSRTTIKTWFSRLDISGTEYEYEIPEAELRELYCDDKKSIEDIADFYGCSYLAVRNRLQNYGIEIRSSHEMIVDADDTSYRDKEWLKTQYNKKDKSRQVIADECGVSESTIQHWMNKFGIEARSLSDAQEQRALRRDLDYMNEELLRELYWVEEMTQRQIADELGATQGAVQIWMNHHDIDIRYAGAHGQTYETKRGEYVRSSPERTIANWLYENGIDYEYEPDPDSIDLRPDFLIEGDLVEYWGMLGREEYVDRMHEKLDRYDSAGVEIVSLFPHHLSKLDAKLSQYL